MQEIEVKFLDINKTEIIGKLKSLKAKKIFEGNIETTFYDFKDNSLRKQGKTVRLRTKGNAVELTFKKAISKQQAKIMEEKNFNLKNLKEAKIFLKSLNLIPTKTLPKKHRISYQLKDIHFDMDKYTNIPLFLEIESDEINKIKRAANLLNLDFKKSKTFSAMGLLNYYKRK